MEFRAGSDGGLSAGKKPHEWSVVAGPHRQKPSRLQVTEPELSAAALQRAFVQSVTAVNERIVSGPSGIDMGHERQKLGRGIGARLLAQACQGFGGPASIRQVQQWQID
jgi:hypothetical protein